MFKTIIAIAAVAATTGAIAAPSQMSDMQYLSAVRCQALMSSSALGKEDTTAINSVVKSQGAGRVSALYDRADDVRSTTLSEAARANATTRASLVAERDGACQAFASNGSSMSATPSGAN